MAHHIMGDSEAVVFQNGHKLEAVVRGSGQARKRSRAEIGSVLGAVARGLARTPS
jgi:hypothetical protein